LHLLFANSNKHGPTATNHHIVEMRGNIKIFDKIHMCQIKLGTVEKLWRKPFNATFVPTNSSKTNLFYKFLLTNNRQTLSAEQGILNNISHYLFKI